MVQINLTILNITLYDYPRIRIMVQIRPPQKQAQIEETGMEKVLRADVGAEADSETEQHQECETSYHGSEGNTCSNYNQSQYFDSLTPEEALELYQQAQNPTL